MQALLSTPVQDPSSPLAGVVLEQEELGSRERSRRQKAGALRASFGRGLEIGTIEGCWAVLELFSAAKEVEGLGGGVNVMLPSESGTMKAGTASASRSSSSSDDDDNDDDRRLRRQCHRAMGSNVWRLVGLPIVGNSSSSTTCDGGVGGKKAENHYEDYVGLTYPFPFLCDENVSHRAGTSTSTSTSASASASASASGRGSDRSTSDGWACTPLMRSTNYRGALLAIELLAGFLRGTGQAISVIDRTKGFNIDESGGACEESTKGICSGIFLPSINLHVTPGPTFHVLERILSGPPPPPSIHYHSYLPLHCDCTLFFTFGPLAKYTQIHKSKPVLSQPWVDFSG